MKRNLDGTIGGVGTRLNRASLLNQDFSLIGFFRWDGQRAKACAHRYAWTLVGKAQLAHPTN
jgi:hypothetical protein